MGILSASTRQPLKGAFQAQLRSRTLTKTRCTHKIAFSRIHRGRLAQGSRQDFPGRVIALGGPSWTEWNGRENEDFNLLSGKNRDVGADA
jgi:hypothetical protein